MRTHPPRQKLRRQSRIYTHRLPHHKSVSPRLQQNSAVSTKATHHLIRHPDPSSGRSYRPLRSGGTPAFCRCLFFVCHSERSEESPHFAFALALAVVCSCCHPERVFRARRPPTKLAPPIPPGPFSQQRLRCPLSVRTIRASLHPQKQRT